MVTEEVLREGVVREQVCDSETDGIRDDRRA